MTRSGWIRGAWGGGEGTPGLVWYQMVVGVPDTEFQGRLSVLEGRQGKDRTGLGEMADQGAGIQLRSHGPITGEPGQGRQPAHGQMGHGTLGRIGPGEGQFGAQGAQAAAEI